MGNQLVWQVSGIKPLCSNFVNFVFSLVLVVHVFQNLWHQLELARLIWFHMAGTAAVV
jgi:hypothetical protein